MAAYDDWNHLYENTWPTPSFTYSKKWQWHYRDTPYIKYVSVHMFPVEQEGYKKTGPGTSNMYKRAFPQPVYTSGFVNNLGDL